MCEKDNSRPKVRADSAELEAGLGGSVSWLARATILVLLSAASACGLALDNDELLARAVQAETKGDLRAAVIDLRTVLQDEPDNVQARLMLGRIALKSGDAFEAEKSLRRAVELGVPISEVIEDLGLAMLGQEAYEAVLNEIDPGLVDDEASRRAVLRIRGEAEMGLVRKSRSVTEKRAHIQSAQDLFSEVLESDPNDPQARMGLAVAYLAQGRTDEARAEIDAAITANPEFVRAYIARGKLDLEAGRLEQAIADFSKAEELGRAERNVALTAAAIAGLADAHFAGDDLDSVKATSKRLTEVAPNSIPALYLSARIAMAEGDYQEAGDHLQQILSVAPDWEPALLLYGTVNLQEGNAQQAEAYFNRVLRTTPNDPRAQRGLAEARVMQNDPEGALQALGPSLGAENVSSNLLAAGGQLSLRTGDVDAGVELLERAAANDPNNLERQMDLAVAYITAGNVDRAVEILEQMPGDDESAYRRGVLLVLTMQQRGEYAEAQGRLDSMLKDYPDSSPLWNLKGGLYQRSGDLDAAAEAFAKAIETDQKNTGAMLNLARLEIAEGNSERAEALYRDVLEILPGNAAAMTGLAQVALRQGDSAAAIDLLQRARAANDTALQPRLVLARLYLQLGDADSIDSASAIASEAVSIDRNNPETVNLDGLVKLRSGRLGVAETRFRAASQARPDEPRFVFNRARTLVAMGRSDEAYALLGDMYARHPEHPGTAVLYATLQARNENWDQAFAIADDLQSRYPDSPIGYSIEGDLNTARRDDRAALAAYEAAMNVRPMTSIALRISELRMKTGVANPEEPYLVMLETSPDDLESKMLLAQIYQRTERPALAIEQYRGIIAQDADNAVALNNLAWIYFETGDEQAEATAAKAYAAAPENGAIVDTYGWILLANGKTDEAVAVLREAVANSEEPGNAEIRFHLASALVESGEVVEAKGVLEELLDSDVDFESKQDAESMLKNL